MEPNTNDEIQSKLVKARLAMSTDSEKEEWQNREQYLQKRKQEAVLAMTSNEQKAKIETEIREAKEKEASQKKLEELQQRRKELEEQRKKDAGKQQELTDKKAEEERQKKITEILESKAEISGLVTRRSSKLRPIRTYNQDMAETVREDQISASKIIIQEKAKRLAEAKQKEQSGTKREVTIAFASVVLIIIGLVIGAFTLWQRVKTDTAIVTPEKKSLIFANKHIRVETTNKTQEQIQTELAGLFNSSTTDQKESIDDVYFTKKVKVIVKNKSVTQEENLKASEYLMAISPNIADNLNLFIKDDFMVGIYHGYKISPFFIFQTDNYKSLANIFLKDGQAIIANLYNQFWDGQTIEDIKGGQFKDTTIKNYDLRVIKNQNNDTLAIYSFLNSNTLLIAQNEEIFQKVLNSYLTSENAIK